MARPYAACTVAVAIAALLAFADDPAAGRAEPIESGRDLFVESCASCHGIGGGGTSDGPSLLGSGAAAADFYLRTGRMPLSSSNDQAVRKDPAFSPKEIERIVAYVASLGEGPAIPSIAYETASLQRGAELYVANCAPCHG
ncbi:MAG: c-type cytochrome, partial [Actinomycetota bacterium]|nr:c-type cytochrome [Actinomycetota bacterium]